MRIKKFSKFTNLFIIWDDITSDASWIDKEGIDKAKTASVQTLGFYLGTKKRVLKVAHSITDGESDCTCIPWSVIKDIKELEIK